MLSTPLIGHRSGRATFLVLALVASFVASLVGGVLAPSLASAQTETILATDGFDRPDEVPFAVGGNWQQAAGAGSSSLVSNRVAGVAGEAIFGWQGAGTFDDTRQFARARVVQLTAGEIGLALLTGTGQAVVVAWQKPNNEVLIFSYVAGAPRPAISQAPSSVLPGDLIEAELLDGVIYAKVNGQVVASATNTTGLTSGRPGFQTFLSGGVLDDWEAGTPPAFTIGGTILENAVGLAGVQVSASGHYGRTTVTDANGDYLLPSVPGGATAVVLKPNLAGHTTTPATRTIVGPVAANVVDEDFTSVASSNPVVAFDDFDRGVELPLVVGGTWQKAAGAGVAHLADHQIVGVGLDAVYFWQGPGVFDPTRQSARATVVSTTGQVGLALLAGSGHAIVTAWDRSISTLYIYWYSGGVIRGSLATASSTIQAGDLIEAELLDGVVYAKVNGLVVASAANTTSLTTGRPGFEVFRTGGRIDGWEARTPTPYTLSGTVTENAVGLPGVQISASGLYGRSTTTDANGDYALTGVPAGATSILLTPNLAGHTPTPLTLTVAGPIAANVVGLDFESAASSNPLIAFDAFDRPAEVPIVVGGNWQKSSGAGSASLVGNEVAGLAGEAVYTWQGPGVFDDARQAARARVVSAAGELGLSLLGSGGQALVVAWQGASGTVRIFWYSGGIAQSTLATMPAPIQVGDVLEALVLDGTIYAKVNGTVVASAVNTTPVLSGRPGFATSVGGARFDDWETITPPAYTLTGTISENAVGLADVVVRASGLFGGRATTDANGVYTLTGVPAGAIAIRLTPTLAGHAMTPIDRIVAGPVATNVAALDFTSTPSSAPSVVEDDFDRPAEVPLQVGGDWQKVAGAGTASLTSNQIVGVGADAVYAWQGPGVFDDTRQFARARVVATTGQVGLALLASSGKAIVAAWDRSVSTLYLYWYSGGVIQSNLATVSATIQAGDVIEAELLGGVVYAKVNGVVVASAANTTSLTTGRPGFEVFRAGGRLDDWEAGTPSPRSIGGTITENGLGLPGVLVTATGVYGKTTTTDANGVYNLPNVPIGASSIVLTPNLVGHNISPVSRTVAGPVLVDVLGQDFTSTPSNNPVVAFDDFNRPDELPLIVGGNWAKAVGAGNVDLLNDAIVGLAAEAVYVWQGPGLFDDAKQYARARVVSTTGQVGLVLLGGSGRGFVAAWNQGISTLYLYWYANGSNQGTLAQVTSTIQAGDVIEAELLGGVFSAKVNGVVVASTPNTTSLVSGKPGFETFLAGGRLDDWEAGLARFACEDGADNDGDAFVDENDPGCASASDPSERNAAIACDDGADNDGDLLVDLFDPGCASPTDPSEVDFVAACQNGLDDDGDGLVDLADPGCAAPGDLSEQNAAVACDDGLDNDADGLVDLADPGCANGADASEQNAAVACDDGADNDGDLLIDLADPGCANAADASEGNAAVACDDGADNDGDALVDLADPGCASVSDASEQNAAFVCDDGTDNDGDGLVDANDPGCANATDASEQNAAIACDDGVDNDGDLLIDFPADPECTSALDPTEDPEPTVPMLPPAGVVLLAGALAETARRALRRRASDTEA